MKLPILAICRFDMNNIYGAWTEDSNKVMREQEAKALEKLRVRKGAGDQDPSASAEPTGEDQHSPVLN